MWRHKETLWAQMEGRIPRRPRDNRALECPKNPLKDLFKRDMEKRSVKPLAQT